MLISVGNYNWINSSGLSKILSENTLELNETSRLPHQNKSPNKVFFSAEIDVL